jgi:hypothetical protein
MISVLSKSDSQSFGKNEFIETHCGLVPDTGQALVRLTRCHWPSQSAVSYPMRKSSACSDSTLTPGNVMCSSHSPQSPLSCSRWLRCCNCFALFRAWDTFARRTR